MKRIDAKERCGYCGGHHNTAICPKTYSGSIDHDYDSCEKHA